MALGYRRYVPSQWRAAVRARLGSERFDQVKGEFESALLTSNVVWEQTKAYALGAGGNIYVNVAGREPGGIVEPGTAYEQVRQELVAALMTMRDPESGKPIVKQVHRREELYSGPFLEQAPDLIIEWTDYAYWGRGQYDSQAPVFQRQRHLDFSDQPLTGSHRLEGILIAHGPGIRQGETIEGTTLLDLAPTLLGMLGIQAPKEMDGRFLSPLFDAEYADQLQSLLKLTHPTEAAIPSDHQFTPEEEALIAEHLRSLGYL
jgi:predicted AlkP superfamily phosphohydrolase/phosphomutase